MPSDVLSEAQERFLKMLASEPLGCVDCEDERLDEFSDDGPARHDTDTINQCFQAKLARQVYDTDRDTGYVEILPAGRALIGGER